MTVEWLDQVYGDLDLARSFYNRQQLGLGDDFVEAALREGRLLPRTSGVHRSFGGFHRYVMDSYPFGIFYDSSGDRLIIAGVFDLRQDPRVIREQLQGRR